MVALAVLMPIVACMGGNAGTQTMTVTVRALATRELSSSNAVRIIRREMFVGLFNGVVFAMILGIVAAFWFGVTDLGLVIGARHGDGAVGGGARRHSDPAGRPRGSVSTRRYPPAPSSRP